MIISQSNKIPARIIINEDLCRLLGYYMAEGSYQNGLMFSFKPDEKEAILSKVRQLLENPALKKEWNKKREKLINEKVDLTEFIVQEILKCDV